MAGKYDIKPGEKIIDELLGNIVAGNESRSDKSFVIQGNVKSLAKLITDKLSFPCPLQILSIFIQHFQNYGPDYLTGKGK